MVAGAAYSVLPVTQWVDFMSSIMHGSIHSVLISVDNCNCERSVSGSRAGVLRLH